MRKHLMGLAAAAVVTISAAPAMAGGFIESGLGGLFSGGGCAAVNPCGSSYGYASYSYQQPVVYSAQPQYYYAAQPQYYYVNQGPTYTGPGTYAPVASYQQRAVSGWSGYGQGYYGYNGGPYANASHHYYDGAPAYSGPAVYSYRRAYRPNVRYGYSRYAAPRHRHVSYRPRHAHAPRVVYAPRYAAPRYRVAPQQYRYPRQHVLRRYN